MKFGPTTIRARQGAVLLEVLLALLLFVGAAAVVTSSMNASLEGLERLRLNTHAGNLAGTVLAELQLGGLAADFNGEQPFAKPFDEWTWELALVDAETETGEASGLTQVEVVVRRNNPRLVHRQAQWVNLEKEQPSAPLSMKSSPMRR